MKFYSVLVMLALSSLLLVNCGEDDSILISCDDGILNGDEDGIDCGGSNCIPCENCMDGIQNADETGVDCGGANCDPCKIGLHGTWISAGSDVSLYADQILNLDSIWFEFKTDLTYKVVEYKKSGDQGELIGTFEQNSTGNDIWTVSLSQTSPSIIAVSGIFEIINLNQLKYETVEENGANIPPTVEDGFGSSNNGALLITNIQTYQRLE